MRGQGLQDAGERTDQEATGGGGRVLRPTEPPRSRPLYTGTALAASARARTGAMSAPRGRRRRVQVVPLGAGPAPGGAVTRSKRRCVQLVSAEGGGGGVSPSAGLAVDSPGGVSPSAGLRRRRGPPTLALSYCEADRRRAARALRRLAGTEPLRVVDYGAGHGEFLVGFAADLRAEGAEVRALIGIDGFEHTRGDRFDEARVRRVCAGEEVRGLEAPCAFADAGGHAVVGHRLALRTVGHFYEGGVFGKSTAEEVLELAVRCAPGSLFLIVISESDPTYPETGVTEEWLAARARAAGLGWVEDVAGICEEGQEGEPTMKGVVFRREAM